MTIKIEQTSIFDFFGIKDEAIETISVDELSAEQGKECTKSETTETISTVVMEEAKEKTDKDVNKGEKQIDLKGKRLSAFDDKEVTDSKKAGSKVPAKTSTKNDIGDKFELNPDTVINYAGHPPIPVTRYFTVEEITNGIERKQKGEIVKVKIEEKDLIKKLNEDFAELIPKLTTLVYCKKENMVVPVLKAREKGVEIDSKESSPEGSFSSPKRIPFRLLADFIAIAKQFSDEHQSEIHADIYYDYDEDNFFMDFPKQIVHTLWVNPIEEPVETAMKFMGRRYRKVMEIHSHHRMAPIPSSTDNASERAPILYAIVGRIDDFFPSISVRTFNPNKQEHIPLSPWQIFEYPFAQAAAEYDLSGVEVSKHD
jgi:hypothetical protein